MTPKDYKDNFHNIHLQNSINSAKEILPLFFEYFKPNTLLDVGCGLGSWLSVAKENNCEVFGIDGAYVKEEDLLVEKSLFKAIDLNEQYNLEKKFDLAISLEVAEHIFQENAKTFIESLCSHSDIVLFSAAVPHQEGTLHYNEQNNDYWVQKFDESGYQCYDFLRHIIWNNTKISWWYRQNLLIFVKKTEINNPKYQSITSHKIVNEVNTYIHPELFNYKSRKSDKFEKILNSPYALLKYYLRGKKIS